MPDTYLDIAERVIRHAGRPITAKQIMTIAQSLEMIPEHWRGATRYKTLGARLSEQILRRGKKSKFCRTGPGKFFLRDLVEDQGKAEFLARRRSKDLAREIVLAVPRSRLSARGFSGTIRDVEAALALLRSDHAVYVDRRLAEKDHTLKQVVTYIVVSKGKKVLSYRRGKFSNASDEIRGARSIGFGGHVTQKDCDFLDRENAGIYNNAIRELLEELAVSGPESSRVLNGDSFYLHSFLNVDETEEAQKHMAAVIFYFCRPDFEPKKGELSINDLNWLDVSQRPNHLNDFELWSRILLEQLFTSLFQAPHLESLEAWKNKIR